MHPEAHALVERELYKLHPAPKKVLDVGSFDVNGSLRPLVEGRGWEYVGLDIHEGKNVDVVAENPYHFPFKRDTFDVVVTACALHNVAKPWLLFPQMARVLKVGGTLIVHTVWDWGRNEHPDDYWRIQPSGLTVLFDECECLEDYAIETANDHDLIGTATKKADA